MIKIISGDMKKIYQGNCIENPFHTIDKIREVVYNAEEISKSTFLKNVGMTTWGTLDTLKFGMKVFPNDFTYYKYKNIYFFRHSGIEYFFW